MPMPGSIGEDRTVRGPAAPNVLVGDDVFWNEDTQQFERVAFKARIGFRDVLSTRNDVVVPRAEDLARQQGMVLRYGGPEVDHE